MIDFIIDLFFDRTTRHPSESPLRSAYGRALAAPRPSRVETFDQILGEKGIEVDEDLYEHFAAALEDGASTRSAFRGIA